MHTNFKRFIFLISIFFFSISITRSQVIIKGKVVDAVSRQPLENASVVNEDNIALKTTTDRNGNFSMNTTGSSTTLSVTYIGYRNLIAQTDSNYVKVEMQPALVNLQDVIILQKNSFSKFSTLSKIDLDLKPVQNTQELLRLVPGLFIAQHAGGGKAEQIFLRGFDSDHGTDVQVSIDGMPVNMVSHAHGQGYADAHFIIPETINNIDFGAGPYYTQRGNLNTAGYVAFSTFNNIPQSRFQVEAGRFNTYRSLLMFDLLKKNKDRQSAYLASEYYYSNGPTINNQNLNRFNVFGKYNLAVNNSTQFTASFSAFKSDWDASGQVPTRAVEEGIIGRFGSIDPSEGGNTERYNANAVLSHTFANGSTWENQAWYSRYKFNLYSNFTFFLNDAVNGDEINQAEERNLYGYLSKYEHKSIVGKAALRSTYGAGFRYDATHNSKLAHVVNRKFLDYYKLGNIKEMNAFAFINEEINFGKFLIDAGARFDYFHSDYLDKLSSIQKPARGESIVSPKLNIQYTLNSKVQFYVKSGKGFHSNDSRVVVANDGKQILPAAYGTDIGIIFKPTSRLLLNVAAWYLYLQQEFVYVGDDGNVEPSGKTRREGIDVIARYQFSRNLFGNVNINFTKPRAIGEAKGQDYIPLAPVTTSTGGLFYKASQGFNGSVTYRYIKNRPANEDNSIIAKGYFLLDASVNYTTKKYEIGLALENIFDVDWNEAQFATESRLQNEPIGSSFTELNFTPGIPFFARLKFAVFF
ncbi:MAG: TonB-dependent receptor [Ginsengibacter sp.]